jgi:CHAP domain
MTSHEDLMEITREQAEANPELCADPTQTANGVLDDSIPDFDEHVMHASEAVILESPASGAAAGSSITAHQRHALALALVQRGPKETIHRDPVGSNCNPYSKYFGFGCQFWCADFVSYCIDRTGNNDRKVPWGYPSAVRNITAWGQKRGKIHSMPREGDIFTYKNGDHTGLVLSANGSSFMTVEGNTTGQEGTFYVASHSRDASSGQYFFVRWEF